MVRDMTQKGELTQEKSGPEIARGCHSGSVPESLVCFLPNSTRIGFLVC